MSAEEFIKTLTADSVNKPQREGSMQEEVRVRRRSQSMDARSCCSNTAAVLSSSRRSPEILCSHSRCHMEGRVDSMDSV